MVLLLQWLKLIICSHKSLAIIELACLLIELLRQTKTYSPQLMDILLLLQMRHFQKGKSAE